MFMIPWFAIRSFQLFLGGAPRSADEDARLSPALKEDAVNVSSGNELLMSSSNEGLTFSMNDGLTSASTEGLTSSSNVGLTSASNEGLTSSSNEGLMSESNEGLTSSSNEGLTYSSNERLTSASNEGLTSSSNEGLTSSCQEELNLVDSSLKQAGAHTRQVAPNSESQNKQQKQHQEIKNVLQEMEAPQLQQQVQQLQDFQPKSEQLSKLPGQKQQVKASKLGQPSHSPPPQLKPASQPDSNSSIQELQVVNSAAAYAEEHPPVSTWPPQVELTRTPVLAATHQVELGHTPVLAATHQVELGHTPVSAQPATQQHSVSAPKKSPVSGIPQLVKAPPSTRSPAPEPTQTSSRTLLTNSAAGKMSFEWAQKQVEQFKFDFDQADKDKSGALSFQEVYEVLGNVGFKGTQEEAKLIFGHLDRDNDQKVTKQEFEAALKKLPRLSIKEFVLRKAFLQLDKDKSGYLSRAEIEDATKSQEGLDIAASKIADLLIYLCKEDDDGKVSYEEFLRVFGIESAATVMQQVFSKLDTDGSGYLTKEEILEAVKAESELKLKADKIADLLIYWCKDQDKKISYQEFVQVWLQQRESKPTK